MLEGFTPDHQGVARALKEGDADYFRDIIENAIIRGAVERINDNIPWTLTENGVDSVRFGIHPSIVEDLRKTIKAGVEALYPGNPEKQREELMRLLDSRLGFVDNSWGLKDEINRILAMAAGDDYASSSAPIVKMLVEEYGADTKSKKAALAYERAKAELDMPHTSDGDLSWGFLTRRGADLAKLAIKMGDVVWLRSLIKRGLEGVVEKKLNIDVRRQLDFMLCDVVTIGNREEAKSLATMLVEEWKANPNTAIQVCKTKDDFAFLIELGANRDWAANNLLLSKITDAYMGRADRPMTSHPSIKLALEMGADPVEAYKYAKERGQDLEEITKLLLLLNDRTDVRDFIKTEEIAREAKLDEGAKQTAVNPSDFDEAGVTKWFLGASGVQKELQGAVDANTALSTEKIGGKTIHRACIITSMALLEMIRAAGGNAYLAVKNDVSVGGRSCPEIRDHVVVVLSTEHGDFALDVANGTVTPIAQEQLHPAALQKQLLGYDEANQTYTFANLLGTRRDNDGTHQVTFADLQANSEEYRRKLASRGIVLKGEITMEDVAEAFRPDSPYIQEKGPTLDT
ncbi:MAG: hypothetical protein P4M13_07000 [Alphaproteobacteria bacterium]|nr:hypothetical protein [Alphaproteobacteria bacterium]